METEPRQANIACPVGGERGLTTGEVTLVRSVFGSAINTAAVRLRRRRWFPLQPRWVVMAPCGHVHFHPHSPDWSEDFAADDLDLQGLFIHEMTHVWQAQSKGTWYLPLCRPFSRRYDYSLKPGWTLERYGIEQQAEIVRHTFLLAQGIPVAGSAGLAAYRAILPFAQHLTRYSRPELLVR